MDYSQLILSALLFIAVVAAGVFIYRYASLNAQLPMLVQDEFATWKQRAEFEMQEKLRSRFQEWRDKEGQSIHANAQREALVTAHNLFKDWCENELETLRKEQREIAVREATAMLRDWKSEQERTIRQDAIQRSQAVTFGKITEHLVPHLPNFNYNPKDVRFIGSPVDFIIFDGLNNEEESQISEVVFVEIKTGMSALTKRERMVRDAVKAGRVKWVEWNSNRELQQGNTGLFE
jgi:predicted Holliday junction resolvase-like endonuclease